MDLAVAMIDKFVLQIPFKEEHCILSDDYQSGSVDLKEIAKKGVPMAGGINFDTDGNFSYEDLRHPFESLPSSYSSMAMKIFDHGCGANGWPYVEIKASPAKILQGHNVYGSDDPKLCGLEMLALLSASYGGLYDMLNIPLTDISVLDSTFSSRTDTQQQCDQFILACGNVSNGQTKAREGYATTAYFNAKKSRLKRLKIYVKFPELLEQVKELRRTNRNDCNKKLIEINSSESLIDYSRCLIRFEASIQRRFLERRSIPTNFFKFCKYADEFQSKNKKPLTRSLFEEAFRDVFSAFEGVEMTVFNDDEIQNNLKAKHGKVNKQGKVSYSSALAAFRTYRNIRSEGWKPVLESMSSSTFYRHISMLKDVGISKAHLQNLHSGRQNNVIPMVRFIDIDFSNQHPQGWQEPVSQFLSGDNVVPLRKAS